MWALLVACAPAAQTPAAAPAANPASGATSIPAAPDLARRAPEDLLTQNGVYYGCKLPSDCQVKDIGNYIVKGVLWQAFEAEQPTVVLIDEVDKADIEFPNDLLRELDRMEFHVYETRQTIQARHRPIVFITSNNEKELPDAFLRRCFFHYIRFPDRDTMQRIVDVHFPGLRKDLLTQALEVFFGLRDIPGLKKKPSTSELIDWLKLLVAEDISPEALHSTDGKAVIPPLHGALLKNEQDVHLFERLAFMARRER